MIKFNKVTKIFKSDLLAQPFVALDDVSFDIPEGSMVGFLGANGAGKTTSLKIIMDFIRPSSGEVQFGPSLGQFRSDIFRNIGFLPERPYFYPTLSGEDFLIFMGKLSGLTRNEIQTEMKRWAPRFKIEHALKRELKTYSKGMLQRIGFLATIIHHPKLVILDEPLSGLDPIGRKELKDVIIEVHKEGKTVFFSSHIVPDIEEICDRVIFLKDGKLVYNGPVGDLISDSSQTDYIVSVKIPSGVELEVLFKNVTVLPENLRRYVVQAQNKDNFLLDIIQKKGVIFSLEMNRPSLEEIFYKTKGADQ
jgi:ABC-2 type transport system ATP-binding protein